MQYHVQDPQGNDRIIEGPDGASDEEIISQAQKLFGHSGALPPTGIDQIRNAIVPSRPDPMATTFQQDVNQAPGASNPIEQRLLQNANTAAAGYDTGQLASWLAAKALPGAANVGTKVLDYLQSIKQGASGAAEAAAPAQSSLEAGLNAKDALSGTIAANKATAQDLYSAIPKDVKVPLTTAQDTADSVINQIKDLPKSFQTAKIRALAGDIQNLDSANVGAIQAMRSTLGDIAVNGEGVEKVYAAQLGKALAKDLDSFGQTSVLPLSQGPSLEAQDLRAAWGRNAMAQSGTPADTVAPYVKPEVFQNPVPRSAYTNQDIVNNLNKANSYYSDMAELHNNPLVKAMQRANPEQLPAVVFRKGNVGDVNVAKAVLGDGYSQLQGQFYQQLLNAKNVGTALGKYSDDFLQAALTPQQIVNLQNVAKFNSLVSKAKIGAGIIVGGTAVGGAIKAGSKLWP